MVYRNFSFGPNFRCGWGLPTGGLAAPRLVGEIAQVWKEARTSDAHTWSSAPKCCASVGRPISPAQTLPDFRCAPTGDLLFTSVEHEAAHAQTRTVVVALTSLQCSRCGSSAAPRPSRKHAFGWIFVAKIEMCQIRPRRKDGRFGRTSLYATRFLEGIRATQM